MKAILEYHVVSNEVGTILAVYGAALLSEAQEKARVIERTTGCKTWLHNVGVSDYRNRPRVNQTISMKNAHPLTPAEV